MIDLQLRTARLRITFWARLSFGRDLVIQALRAMPDIEFVVCDSLPDCLTVLPGTDGLLLYNAREEDARRLIEGIRAVGHGLRWMHFLTAGREGFDAVGIPEGMAVTHVAGASAPVVAEHAMALLLALGRRVPDTLTQMAEHRWDRGIAAQCSSLEGKTLAIVGYGRIGQEIAKRSRGFGLKTIALSRSGRADGLCDEACTLDQLQPVLARSDVVMVAMALTPDTRHLLDRAALAACRPGTLLVNVARGGVVDQAALRDALASGHLAGAGLDVTDPEPLPADDPLWDCPNLIVSPHIAVEGSPATAHRLAVGTLQAVQNFVAGHPPQPA